MSEPLSDHLKLTDQNARLWCVECRAYRCCHSFGMVPDGVHYALTTQAPQHRANGLGHDTEGTTSMHHEPTGARLEEPPQREYTAYEAAIYFDDGDDPTADIDSAGIYTTVDAARQAAVKAVSKANETAEGGHWVGYVEKVVTDYEDWADRWVWEHPGPPEVIDGPFT